MHPDLSVYIPHDRRRALAAGADLPDRASGAALLADISGFTPLAEALARQHGSRRGAEELVQLLNQVYSALIATVAPAGGSVIGFAGDAITCWFDDLGDGGWEMGAGGAPSSPASQLPSPTPRPPSPAAPRAAACALAMQAAMGAFGSLATPGGQALGLTLSVGIVHGVVRRLLVGDPQIQLIDTLAGTLLDRLVAAEGAAGPGEVLADPAAAAQAARGLAARVAGQRAGPRGLRLAALAPAGARATLPAPAPPALSDAQARPFLPAAIAAQLRGGEPPLAELRPAVALMLRFSGIDYDRDPAAGQKLDRYIRWVQGALARYGGTLIDVTMGDRDSYLYAAFGAPAAHDDDAARAVGAAIELSQPPGLPFIATTQIGIAHGQMRAGIIGGADRRAYGVLGDPANLAFRLMQAAPPGAIRCDQSTYRLAARRWRFAELPAARVKGKADPIAVYEPRGPSAGDRPPADAPRALVGRAAEIRQLDAALAAVASGDWRVVAIDGEAGIGKSQLIAELSRLARGRGMAELAGAGQSIEQQTPYRAWRDIFTAYFGLAGADDPAERRARVRAGAAGLAPALAERLPLLNDVLSLGLPDTALTRSLDTMLRRESLGGLLAELLRARAAERPLLLVIEDCHWLDSLSWELVGRAAQSLIAAGAPVLLALTMRPIEADHPALRQIQALLALPGAARLALAALPDGALRDLVAGRLGLAPADLPEAVADLVRERAGGNPFFAGELAAALRDQGLIAIADEPGDRPRCVVAGDLGRAAELLPDTLQGLLLERIDRLAPAEQLTLKVASVIGPTFGFPLLSHTRAQHALIADSALKNQLRALAAQRYTELEAPEPDLAYRFRHVLSQEAAYQTMLYAQRRDLHRAVAQWYESAAAPAALSPHYPLLAHHYRQAEDAERERHYAQLAGVRAAEQYANAEALAFFSRAIELTRADDLAARYELLLARELVYDLQSQREPQRRDLDDLGALAEALADDRRRAAVALRQSNYAEKRSDFAAAVAAAQRAVEFAQAAGDQARVAAGRLAWGMALLWWTDYRAAREQLDLALPIARAAGLRDIEAELLRGFGSIAEEQGHYDEARAWYQQSLDLSRATGDRQREGWMLNGLGIVAEEQGQHAEARAQYGQALALFQLIGDRGGEAAVLNNLGVVAQDCADYGQARDYFEQSLAINRAIGNRHGESIKLLNLGQGFRHQGDYGQARACYEQALAIARAIGNPHTEPEALAGLGWVQLDLGAPALAREHGAHALRLAQSIGAEPHQALALNLIGHALLESGDPAGAQARFAEARQIYLRIGKPHRALEPLAGLAAAALARGDLAQARGLAEQILTGLAAGLLNGVDAPFRIYLAAYQALRAAEDPRAPALLDQAHALLQERAARIGDLALRRSYLAGVAAHRAIARAWAGGAG